MKYSLDFKVEFLGDSVTDERGHVHQELGLLPVAKKRNLNPYTSSWINAPERTGILNEPSVCLARNIGMPAWKIGEKVYVIDYLALSEPFLARIPARKGARVGHYFRVFPSGYLETIITGKNVIDDKTLSRLYDDVALATRSTLWSVARFSAIWRLNSSYYRNLSRNSDALLWKEMIPSKFLREQDVAVFLEHIADLPVSVDNHLLLPLAVPPAFSPFIHQTEAQAR